jgi:hypothetical protein
MERSAADEALRLQRLLWSGQIAMLKVSSGSANDFQNRWKLSVKIERQAV